MDRRSPLVGSLVVVFAGCLFALLGVLSRWSFDVGIAILAAAVIIQRSAGSGQEGTPALNRSVASGM